MKSLFVLMLTASPLVAQEFYGQAELSFGQSQMSGAPVALQGADGSLGLGRADLSFGALWDSGLYLQGDLGLAVTGNNNSSPNTYNNSRSLVVHIGRDTGTFSYGAFAGSFGSDHDNDASDDAQRFLVGLEGSSTLWNRWAINGHLGYLGGTSGTDSVATVTDGMIAGAGLSLAVSERFDLSTSLGYVNGKMDSPASVVEAWQFELRADYDIRRVPGLSVFGAVQYGEYHQKEITTADDITDVTSVMAGVTYRFGKASRPRTANLSYVEPFLANTGGVLE